MNKQAWADKPTSEATFYILLALIGSLHGYSVMSQVDELSQGTVAIGPKTLYGAIARLTKANLIFKTAEVELRKIYGLTQTGKNYLQNLIQRLEIMSENGQRVEAQL